MSEKGHIICFRVTMMFAVLLSLCLAANASCILPKTCEELRDCINAPSYYCECHNGVNADYGIDTIISGPTWFTASFSSFTEGFLAYWFAEDSVLLEIYAFCASDTASISRVMHKNTSGYITAREVKEKAGTAAASGLLDNMDLHLFVKPFGNSGGRAACFSGKEGAHSYCDNPLKIVNYANYIFKDTATVYQLDVRQKPTRSSVMRYRNEYDMTEKVGLTINFGSCDGEIVATHVFTDSVKPYFIPLDVLQRAYEEKQPLFFNFTKPQSKYEANIYYRPSVRFVKDTVDTMICVGMGLELADTLLTETTVYTDTAFNLRSFTTDTVFITTYNLTMTEAKEEKTLQLKGTQFPYLYNYNRVDNYGDYRFTIKKEGECDHNILLHVTPKYTVTRQTVDTAVCKGINFVMGKQKLTYNGSLRDTTYSGKYLDQQLITTYKVTFTNPELEYDTITIHKDLMPYSYYGNRITSFGTKTVTVKQKDECDRKVQLTVLENDGKLTYFRVDKDTTGCAADGIQFPDTLLFESTVYTDTSYVSDTTVRLTTWHIKMEELDKIIYDTLALEEKDIPYKYSDACSVYHFGENRFVRKIGACEAVLVLEVVPRYVYVDVDTTICTGQSIEIEGKEITKSMQWADTVASDKFTDRITRWSVEVTPAPVEKKEVEIEPSELPYTFEGKEYTEAGVYDIVTADEDGCEQILRLNLVVGNTAVEYVQATAMMQSTILDAGDEITVICSEKCILTLTDATGREVGIYRLGEGRQTITLEQTGVYVAIMRSSNGNKIQKLLVR